MMANILHELKSNRKVNMKGSRFKLTNMNTCEKWGVGW